MTHLVSNVEILYPRVNQCYRFDNAENKSVPCDAFEDGAKYETQFRMDKDQAKALYKAMATAYAERKEKTWPEKLAMPFEQDDDGKYVGKLYSRAHTVKTLPPNLSSTMPRAKNFLKTLSSPLAVSVT